MAGLVLSLAGLSLAMPPISLFLRSKRQLCLPMGNGALDLVPWAGRGAVGLSCFWLGASIPCLPPTQGPGAQRWVVGVQAP